MKKDWTKPKLISLYRGRPEEAVLNACKAQVLFTGPDEVTGIDDCTGSPGGGGGDQCQEIVTDPS